MILKALDLALMMWMCRKLVGLALVADRHEMPEAPKLAKLVISAENLTTNYLLGSSTSTAGLAAAIVGESSGHWRPLLEAMRARDEGRPLGKLR